MDPLTMDVSSTSSYVYNMFVAASHPSNTEPMNLVSTSLFPLDSPSKPDAEQKRKRLKVADPTTWKRNMAKRKIQMGQAHVSVSGKEIPAKKVLPKDCLKCPRKCNTLFTESLRQKIFDEYWKISDINLKRLYLNALIDETDKAAMRTKSPTSRRVKSREFWLPKDGKRVRVCQGFFLATLNISNTVVANVLKKRNDQLIIEADKRGKHKPALKRPETAIQYVCEHINSFPRVPSQDGYKDKQYLPSDLNLVKMYDLYLEKCDREKAKPEKLWLYRHVFHTKFNLAFQTPKKDSSSSCHKCYDFENMVKKW